VANTLSAVEVRHGFPTTLTILATYRCTAECKDCCFQSNPRIEHRVPQANLLRYIDEAAALGTVRIVVFSGGESFILGKDLVELVARASFHGLPTRIVTNGYWATSEAQARRRLEPLIEAGLGEINFSTGDDHAEFVPLKNIVIGMSVALKLGLGQALMIEERVSKRVSRESILEIAKEIDPLLHAAIIAKIIYIAESPWMEFAPDGHPITQKSENLANRFTLAKRDPCKSILTTIVVTPDEHLGMCCGISRERISEVDGGDLRERSMRSMVDTATTNFMLIWLLVEGPERMLAWAATHDPSIDWENRYSHNCDACRAFFHDARVKQVIAKHGHEKFGDVLSAYALFLETADDGTKKYTQAVNLSAKLPPVQAFSGAGQLVQLTH